MIQSRTLSLREAIENGKALRDAGNHDEAELVFRQISEQLPDRAAGWLGLGQVMLDQFRASEAIIAFEHAIKTRGPSADLHHAMGTAKTLVGRLWESEAHFKEALTLDPRRADFYSSYSRARRFAETDGVHLAIERRLRDPALTQRDRCQLHFAAGKIYDDFQSFDAAFEHFEQGNQAKGACYNEEQWDDLIQRSIEILDSSTLRKLRASARPTAEIVFIVGMPRTGTTLVEQIVSSHTEVSGAGELHDLNYISGELSRLAGTDKSYPECLTTLNDRSFIGMANYYLQRVAKMSNSPTNVYCDKTPNNFFFVGLMHAVFPNVRVIHCRRNPLDTLLSCYMTNFKVGQEYSYDLADLAHYYAGYNRIMEHWNRVSQIPILNVDYESLVHEQESQSRRLIDFLGLSWQDACLDFQSNGRVVATASNWQVRQPIYRRSIDRCQNYARQLQPLSDALNRLDVDVEHFCQLA